MADKMVQYDDDTRVETLRLYDVLDTMPEEEFDDITLLASEICKTPIALISLVDDKRQWFKSRLGLEARETPREISFCTHAIESDAVFEVNNATLDSRFANNPLVTGAPHIRFYAGAPLITKGGKRLGTLCVINSIPYSIDERQKNSLQILARAVMSLLELRKEKKEAELFKKALDEVSIVSVLDSALNYEYANRKFCEHIAMEASEIVGKSVTDIAIADITSEQEEQALNTIKSGKIYRARIKDLNKLGTESWCNLVLVPFVNKNSELVKVLSLRNDITSEVTMLHRMEEAEALSQMGNWELNLITGQRYWSQGMYRLMEYDYAEYKNESLSLLNMVDGADKERLEEMLNNAIKGEDPVPVSEFKIVTRNGEKKDVLVRTKRRFNSMGKLTTLYGSIRDVTEKKEQDRQIAESEEKYRTLVENSAQMTYTTDVDGTYTYASVHLKKTIGYTDEEILGKKFAFIDGDEWRKKTIGFYVNQLTNNIDETKFVFPIVSKTGAKLWVEQTAWLVRNKEGVTGFRCVLHDVTEQVKTSEAMEEAMRLAEEAREMQQNFLGKMSHEIRTPMNGVVGMVNLLGDTSLNEKQRIYTESIKESAQNMLRIINDILDISKIESGKLIFEETELDLAQIVNSVLFTLKPAAEEKRLLIASHIDNKVPARLVADPVRLNQILLNLSGNAIKFTERGSVIISVSQAAETNEQITLEFKVTDTGIGIAKDKLERVFESFTQAESDTTRKYGGTGLGLTIARQLVEQQGGTISVDSEPGQGTTFTFTFHFKPATELAAASSQARNANIHSLAGVEILLVEDNMMNQRVAKFTLETWGVNVTIADRGYKALDLLKANTYDLVLMDLQMPEMNGIQTTLKIREELQNDTPIMAMTASAMNMEREKCIDAGMNDYISKPFVPEELNLKIYNLVKSEHKAKKVKVINMAAVREIANNDTGFIKDIFDIYVTRTPEIVRNIEKYIDKQEYQLLHGELHNLKNSMGILGAKDVYELLAHAEADTIDKTPSEDTISTLRNVVLKQVLQSIDEASEMIGTL